MEFNEMENFKVDILREIGNIGAGNAATALACLINKRVDMMVPEVKILELNEISDVIGGAEAPVIGIMLRITGDISGYIMFILGIKEAGILVKMIMGKSIDANSESFDEMEISALKELGNILAGSYISAMSTLVNLRIMPDVPELAIDMAGAILSVPAIEFGKSGDTALFIETVFIEGSYKVKGSFFLMPDYDSYNKLLNALGV